MAKFDPVKLVMEDKTMEGGWYVSYVIKLKNALDGIPLAAAVRREHKENDIYKKLAEQVKNMGWKPPFGDSDIHRIDLDNIEFIYPIKGDRKARVEIYIYREEEERYSPFKVGQGTDLLVSVDVRSWDENTWTWREANNFDSGMEWQVFCRHMEKLLEDFGIGKPEYKPEFKDKGRSR